MRYGVENGRTAGEITGPGYLSAVVLAGRPLARRDPDDPRFGNDVVLINPDGPARRSLRVTSDDGVFVQSRSGRPPATIAYLQLSGQTVDLRLAKLSGEAGAWTVDETIKPDRGVGPRPRSLGPDWFTRSRTCLPLPTPAPSSAAPSGGAEASPS